MEQACYLFQYCLLPIYFVWAQSILISNCLTNFSFGLLYAVAQKTCVLKFTFGLNFFSLSGVVSATVDTIALFSIFKPFEHVLVCISILTFNRRRWAVPSYI